MSGHVFVCYSRTDEEFVLQLARNLKDRNVDIWIDQWRIPAGDNWARRIDDALEGCAACVVILSPSSVDSEDVQDEWGAVRDQKKPIVPVLYQDCHIPYRLKQRQWVSFVGRGPDDEAVLNELVSVLGGSPAPPKRAKSQPQKRAAPARKKAAPARKKSAPARKRAAAKPSQASRKKAVAGLEEKPAGRVTRYYSNLGVAGILLTRTIRLGDELRFRGRSADFLQPVESIELDRTPVNIAPAGADIGLKVDLPVEAGDEVFELTEPKSSGPDVADLIGTVIEYYDRLQVAGIAMYETLSVGDLIHIYGQDTNFIQRAESIERNRRKVRQVEAGAEIGLKLDEPASVGDGVYRV